MLCDWEGPVLWARKAVPFGENVRAVLAWLVKSVEAESFVRGPARDDGNWYGRDPVGVDHSTKLAIKALLDEYEPYFATLREQKRKSKERDEADVQTLKPLKEKP